MGRLWVGYGLSYGWRMGWLWVGVWVAMGSVWVRYGFRGRLCAMGMGPQWAASRPDGGEFAIGPIDAGRAGRDAGVTLSSFL